MFKPGSIRKIQVKDFVTYSYVEMYPGPNLNMIIGPNGTGKSTMVAAIILGLGGNPKIVGRGTRISEYVKHGCDIATINIFLQDVHENSFIKVTREFDCHEKSYWKLNNHRSSVGEVQEAIKQFNIQVNNLCQFLPQDRVADFAKLNKKDLLKNTQLALCRDDLIEKQEALIKAREKHKSLLEQSAKQGQNLQEAQDANARLEGRVTNFNKKIKYKERIAHIDRKIAWTEYEEKRSKLKEIKEDKVKAQEIYDKYKNEIKPMEREINVHKQCVSDMQQGSSKIAQKIRTHENHINNTNDEIEKVTAKVRNIEDEMNTKLAEKEQWDKQIEEAVAKLEDMKKAEEAVLTKMSQDGGEKQAITSENSKLTHHKRRLEDQREQFERTCNDSKAEIRLLQNEQTRIENVKQARLEQLRKISDDAYTAVLWLRNNRQRFSGEVFEPIMLEVNVLDNTKAKYVEFMIPLRDRLAFTCTDKNDMNELIRSLREQQGLSINVLHSGAAPQGYNQPRIPIERLKKFGFYTYVNTLFTAPEPIVRYLSQTYRLHNIPVGNDITNKCYENIPKELNVFFSDKFRYIINYSKYSGEKSTRQNQVKSDGGLSLSLDVERLEMIRGQCNEARRKVENLQSQIEKYDAEISKIEDKIKGNREKLIEVQKQKQLLDGLRHKIAQRQQHLQEMRNKEMSPDQIRNEAKHRMKKMIQTMSMLQEMLKNYFKEFENLITQSNLRSIKIEMFRQKIEYLENQIVDSKRILRESEETLSLITDKYNAAMHDAKAQLQKAKGLSNGFTPADNGFDEFRETYDQLGSSIEELSAEKENLNSRIGCLNTADDTEIREYENRVNLIEGLTKNIHSISTDINKISVKMDRMQEEWLAPLNELISAINLRFASAFERMGCAGEVAICQGENDKEYAEYGISIKVTYRSGEPLQELNATVQSGGERAVATAAFMLSLQELTPVPFRCVDEINQGMDANNERRIFELIVETTCQPETAQYFLITPKLVPHLNYSRQLMVHIVHNGPFINPDQKWSFSKLCNPQTLHIQ